LTVQSPQGYPPPPPPKKGMGPLAWIGIGCGAIVVIGLIVLAIGAFWLKNKASQFKNNPARAAMEIAAMANPDLEVVSSDDKAQTVTIHNKKTNETMTLNAEDVKNGHFKVTTDKGSATFDANSNGLTIKGTDEKGKETNFHAGTGAPQNLPSWLPTYPGGQVQGGLDTTSAEGRTAVFTVTTTDSFDKVMQFYEDQMKAGGFKVEKTTATGGDGKTGGSVSGTSADEKRTLQVLVGTGTGSTTATVTFNEKTK
jgi:hypothetical protein